MNSLSLSVCQFDLGTIKDRVRTIYPDERMRGNFYECVCKAGEQMYRLCDPNERSEIVEGFFVCWQKLSNFPFPSKFGQFSQDKASEFRFLCQLLFHLGAVFTESSKFAKIKIVRNSRQFQGNLTVQNAFGDICLAYQRHMRCELQDEKDQYHTEMQQQRENFEQEREQYETRVREALQEREKREAELMAEVEDEKRKRGEEIDALKGDFDAEREDLKEKLRKAEQCE